MRILRNCRLISVLSNRWNKIFPSKKTEQETWIEQSEPEVIVPHVFDKGEKISRTIFSPMNVRQGKFLKNNSFTTPGGIDEVSVNRLNFTNPKFIKKISKIISNPEEGRCYFGLAIIDVEQILDSKCTIVYTPNVIEIDTERVENRFHSDIQIGFVKVPGEPLPAEYSYKVDQLVKKSRFYLDPNIESEEWEGEALI